MRVLDDRLRESELTASGTALQAAFAALGISGPLFEDIVELGYDESLRYS